MSIATVFTDYFEWLLGAIADFLGSAPICYVFYLSLFAIVVNVFFKILHINS